MDESIYRMIGESRESDEEFPGLLSLLLQAGFEGEEGAGDEGMNDGQMRDHLVALYFASHDTTAATLTWTIHL